MGWRVHATQAHLLATIGLGVLFAYATAWARACSGILARGPESAQVIGLIVIMPLSLISNAFISTARMPAVLYEIADWNPISVLAAACRQCSSHPCSGPAIPSWPMRARRTGLGALVGGLARPMAQLAVWLYMRGVWR